MAEINTESKDKSKGGKPKTKKVSTRVDFTPMVDLMFLLITFFMLTTTLIKPQTMEIYMPSKNKVDEDQQTKIKASQAITILLGKDNSLYYYFGAGEKGKDPQVIKTDYSPGGIRHMLLERNIQVVQRVEQLKQQNESRKISDEDYKKLAADARAVKSAPVVVIKSTDEASYKNLVDILDEMQICNIGRYAITDITPYDKELMAKADKPAIN